MAEGTALDNIIQHYTGDDRFEVADGMDCKSEPTELVRSALIAVTNGKPRQLAQILCMAAESGINLASDPDTYRWGARLMIEAISNQVNKVWDTIKAVHTAGDECLPGTRMQGDLMRIHLLQDSLASLDATAIED